jgi:hypothetical protein
MFPSGATCLPVDCCFSELALWKSSPACWSITKRTSSSSHWKLTNWLILNFKHNYIYIRYMYYWYSSPPMEICGLNWLWLSLFRPFGLHLPWTYVVLTDCGYHCLDPLVYTSHNQLKPHPKGLSNDSHNQFRSQPKGLSNVSHKQLWPHMSMGGVNQRV